MAEIKNTEDTVDVQVDIDPAIVKRIHDGARAAGLTTSQFVEKIIENKLEGKSDEETLDDFAEDLRSSHYALTYLGIDVSIRKLPNGGVAAYTPSGSLPCWYVDEATALFAIKMAYRFPLAFEKLTDSWESPRLITLEELEPIESWRPTQFASMADYIKAATFYPAGKIIPKMMLADWAKRRTAPQDILACRVSKGKKARWVFKHDVYVLPRPDGMNLCWIPNTGEVEMANKHYADGYLDMHLRSINTALECLTLI